MDNIYIQCSGVVGLLSIQIYRWYGWYLFKYIGGKDDNGCHTVMGQYNCYRIENTFCGIILESVVILSWF